MVEIFPDLVRAIPIRANFSEQKILVGQPVSVAREPSEEGLAAALKLMLKKAPRAGRSKIVLSFDPSLATTVHSAVVLMRDKHNQPIDEPDLNNRIAQGIWRLFDRERGRAAAKMAVHDLDVFLTDVKVKYIKLDGHKVVNPLGFRAKTLEIQFAHTFNPRAILPMVKKILPEKHLVFFTEGGAAAANILSKASNIDNFLLADIQRDRTYVFLASGATVSSLETFSWGKELLLQSIADYFAVGRGVAFKIFDVYMRREASPAMIKKLEKLLETEFSGFMEKLTPLTAKYDSGAVYLAADFELPEFAFGNDVRRSLGQRLKVLPVHHDLICQKLGFEIRVQGRLGNQNLFSPIACLLDFYFSPHDDRINRIARRHASWLIS